VEVRQGKKGKKGVGEIIRFALIKEKEQRSLEIRLKGGKKKSSVRTSSSRRVTRTKGREEEGISRSQAPEENLKKASAYCEKGEHEFGVRRKKKGVCGALGFRVVGS